MGAGDMAVAGKAGSTYALLGDGVCLGPGWPIQMGACYQSYTVHVLPNAQVLRYINGQKYDAQLSHMHAAKTRCGHRNTLRGTALSATYNAFIMRPPPAAGTGLMKLRRGARAAATAWPLH